MITADHSETYFEQGESDSEDRIETLERSDPWNTERDERTNERRRETDR